MLRLPEFKFEERRVRPGDIVTLELQGKRNYYLNFMGGVCYKFNKNTFPKDHPDLVTFKNIWSYSKIDRYCIIVKWSEEDLIKYYGYKVHNGLWYRGLTPYEYYKKYGFLYNKDSLQRIC